MGMKILKATSYTMGVPLLINLYLGPQWVRYIILSLIIEPKSIVEQILMNHHKLTISHAYAHPSPAAAKR
jgi:hypothetical protein